MSLIWSSAKLVYIILLLLSMKLESEKEIVKSYIKSQNYKSLELHSKTLVLGKVCGSVC